MPLRLDIKKKLQTSSERVKSIDFHVSEPWILSGLYNGTITVYDYETQNLVKSLEVSEYPIRCAVFICRKQWIVTCGDDLLVRVYNYNTMNKVTSFEAHNDFIRHIIVHNKLPLLLTCSDDMTIKVWDWERDWVRAQTYQGNSHYVMMIQWNPKDNHVFASVSLDRTIRIWGIPSNICSLSNNTVNTPNYTLTGHDGGINCLAYSLSVEKPYIVTGSDDKTVRVWDYQTKQCIQILSGHAKSVRSVLYHPQLPLILSCSEDGTIKIWHATTYRLECTLNYMLDRCWCLSVCENILGMGYDEGTIVIKLGSEQPLSTLNSGKIIIAKGTEICQANLRALSKVSSTNSNDWDFDCDDGERIILPFKEIGCSEIYPQDIQFHPNGRFLSICGDGEFVIYTTQALRSKCFGKAIELAWSIEGHFFAIRENGGRIVIYHNFKESFSFLPSYFVDEIFGGQLLGIKSNDFVCFYEWSECRLIRRVDISSNLCNIYWDDLGNYTCLTCTDTFYILKYNKEQVEEILSNAFVYDDGNKLVDPNDGIETAFEFISEVNDKVESGIWISTCFIYITSQLRLQIWMNGFIDLIAYLPEKTMYYILGYVKEIQRIILMNREFNSVTYSLDINYIEYQSCIIKKDFETAENVYWEKIPTNLHTKIAKFLEIQGYKEKALSITDDPDQRFDLALSLGKLELCISILQEMQIKDQSQLTTLESINVENLNNYVNVSPMNKKRWKILGDIALEKGKFTLAIGCYKEVQDLDSLFLIYSCTGDIEGLKYVAKHASIQKQWNTAFLCHILLQDKDSCIDDLIQSDLIPYAALFARCYYPSRIDETVKIWRDYNKKGNDLLANPTDNIELFPYYKESVEIESFLSSDEFKKIPVRSWNKFNEILNTDLMDDYLKKGANYIKSSIWGDEDINIIDEKHKFNNELNTSDCKDEETHEIRENRDQSYLSLESDIEKDVHPNVDELNNSYQPSSNAISPQRQFQESENIVAHSHLKSPNLSPSPSKYSPRSRSPSPTKIHSSSQSPSLYSSPSPKIDRGNYNNQKKKNYKNNEPNTNSKIENDDQNKLNRQKHKKNRRSKHRENGTTNQTNV